jgi:predicted phosphodiesterase
MKIHLLSDLHTEFWRDNKKVMLEALVRPADVLVLAGDIAVGRTNVLSVLNTLAPHYATVIYVPGNHEYYGGLKITEFNDFEKFAVKLPINVQFLNPGAFTVGDVEFIGATLWTNFRNDPSIERCAQRYIVDFARMRRCTPDVMRNEFQHHFNEIRSLYYASKAPKKVIVSHFLPAVDCISPRWRDVDVISSALNGYFANDLGHWIDGLDCATWLFGHTHDAVDVQIGTTRCLARPMGYPGENKQPYEHLIIEV